MSLPHPTEFLPRVELNDFEPGKGKREALNLVLVSDLMVIEFINMMPEMRLRAGFSICLFSRGAPRSQSSSSFRGPIEHGGLGCYTESHD